MAYLDSTAGSSCLASHCCWLLHAVLRRASSFPIQLALWRDEGFALALKAALDHAANRALILDVLGSDRFFDFLKKSIDFRDKPVSLMQN